MLTVWAAAVMSEWAVMRHHRWSTVQLPYVAFCRCQQLLLCLTHTMLCSEQRLALVSA